MSSPRRRYQVWVDVGGECVSPGLIHGVVFCESGQLPYGGDETTPAFIMLNDSDEEGEGTWSCEIAPSTAWENIQLELGEGCVIVYWNTRSVYTIPLPPNRVQLEVGMRIIDSAGHEIYFVQIFKRVGTLLSFVAAPADLGDEVYYP